MEQARVPCIDFCGIAGGWGRARHSTEVAFALLTQQPQVQIPALPFIFTAWFVDSKGIEPI